MTRNDTFRSPLGRQINVRHDHDVGRCVGFDIIMQQILTRLCCEVAADKTVILLNLSCMRLENASLSSAHGGSARSHVRDTVNGRSCKLQHADAPINSIPQLSLMAWRHTVLEKNPTRGRVVAIKRRLLLYLLALWLHCEATRVKPSNTLCKCVAPESWNCPACQFQHEDTWLGLPSLPCSGW